VGIINLSDFSEAEIETFVQVAKQYANAKNERNDLLILECLNHPIKGA
jgi:hypothetical protein